MARTNTSSPFQRSNDAIDSTVGSPASSRGTWENSSAAIPFGIDVDEVYIHCAKALRRSKLWDPATWPDPDDRPRPAQIIKDHVKFDVPADLIEADLEKNYVETLWVAGGPEPTA